jgi:hypothetical protein
MNKMKNEMNNKLDEQIIIGGEIYVKWAYLNRELGIKSNRLKLWRENRGQNNNKTLKYIKLDKGTYLYNLKDVELLIELTRIK